MVKTMKNILILFSTLLIFGCNQSESDIYTLYRSSVTKEGMRIHVGTFDSSNGESYNRENCEISQELFQKQEGVKVKYWCEKGRYKK